MKQTINRKKKIYFFWDKKLDNDNKQFIIEISQKTKELTYSRDFSYLFFDAQMGAFKPAVIGDFVSRLETLEYQEINLSTLLDTAKKELDEQQDDIDFLFILFVKSNYFLNAYKAIDERIKVITKNKPVFHIIGENVKYTEHIDLADSAVYKLKFYSDLRSEDYLPSLSEWLGIDSNTTSPKIQEEPLIADDSLVYENKKTEQKRDTLNTIESNNKIGEGHSDRKSIFAKRFKKNKERYANSDAQKIPLAIPDRKDNADQQWLILHGSSAGTSHASSLCEDNYAFDNTLGNGWGIAVVCDGAGNEKTPNAHYGSAFVAKSTLNILRKMLSTSPSWYSDANSPLPDSALWHEIAERVFGAVLLGLINYAKNTFNLDKKDIYQFDCTVMACIYSPKGLMVAHIGDGRACYRDKAGNWKAMIKPFNTSDGGTAFLPTPFVWQAPSVFIGSCVIEESITAFALMTDGCEDYTYKPKIKFDFVDGKFLDTNKPDCNFWDPQFDYYYGECTKEKNTQKLIENWQYMLDNGKEFKTESDDKTMIFGILKNNP